MKIALIGSETLLGKELTEVVESRLPGAAISSYAASAEGNFGESDGEAIYIESFGPQAVHENGAVLVAGSPEGALKAYTLLKASAQRPVLIDATGHLENKPEARIVSPLGNEARTGSGWLLVVPHPAAYALALTLSRLARYRKLRQIIAHIFEPASERDKSGAAELHQQTTSLLSFKTLDKQVFDAQLSFNLLAQYGEEAKTKLISVEQRIERHTATLLNSDPNGATIPLPSLRVIAAPVFHGYSISLWVEFESGVDAEELGEALASAQIEVRGGSEEPPNNVGVAGQSELSAGDIRIDSNNSRAAWLWIVGDNLRLTAESAVEILSSSGAGQQ